MIVEAEVAGSSSSRLPGPPKYAESYRLDPQLGVLIYLPVCYEKNGQLASAWGSFREAEEIARKRGDSARVKRWKEAEAREALQESGSR